MPSGVLILPLLGGYFFLSWCKITRYFIRKDDRERLIFGSALIGFALLLAARSIVVMLGYIWPELYQWKSNLADIPYLGAASLALLLGVGLVWPINRLIGRDTEIRWTIRLSDNPMERLLHSAELQGRQVLVTLTNNKVYAGPVLWCPMALTRAGSHIEIAPYLSGYREPDTHNLIFDTFYSEALEQLRRDDEGLVSLDQSDFSKVIPVSNIMTIGFFEPSAYLKFQEMNDQTVE